MAEPKSTLPSGHLLGKNVLFNFLGQGVPLLVAVFAIPQLIAGLGTERFGLLTLAWVVIGYFNLFDLGLGRALTQLVAERLASEREHEIPPLVWTSLALLSMLGLVGAGVAGGLSPWLVASILTIPAALHLEALHTFYILALSLPVVVVTNALRGILEAKQRFDLLNLIRVPSSLFVFLGPLLILPFSQNLAVITAVLVLSRVISGAVHLYFGLKVLPSLRSKVGVSPSTLIPVLRLGGWMTVSNVVGPLMVTLDRFIIGALLSLAAVAYYATPYEVVTKLWLIPGAIVGVLFPAFASSFARDRAYTLKLFGRGVKYSFLALFPITLLIIGLAPEGLTLWLGAEFAENSSAVLRWLAAGVFINSLAQVPFALLQGIGRPDLTAKLHLIQLPPYLAAVFWLIQAFGVEGAAMAWTARVAVDAGLLLVLVRWQLPGSALLLQKIAISVGAVLAVFALATVSVALTFKIVALALAVPGYLIGIWLLALTEQEKSVLQNRLGRLQLSRTS
jgi:O-antigen/teichoic acid export membrane protein